MARLTFAEVSERFENAGFPFEKASKGYQCDSNKFSNLENALSWLATVEESLLNLPETESVEEILDDDSEVIQETAEIFNSSESFTTSKKLSEQSIKQANGRVNRTTSKNLFGAEIFYKQVETVNYWKSWNKAYQTALNNLKKKVSQVFPDFIKSVKCFGDMVKSLKVGKKFSKSNKGFAKVKKKK